MSNTKYELEKFTGKNNFWLWQRRMKHILIQHGVSKALLRQKKKPEKINEKDWEDLDAKISSAVCLNLGDEVIKNLLDNHSARDLE